MKNVISQNELADVIQQAKQQGQKVVSTNGIFDFLHAGHVSYLEKARELGDMLVVCLNSDASTKRLKGEGRPINKQDDRAYVLSVLRCVDYVTIFEEDNPAEVLDVLKPSIHTKGGDYKPEDMPETLAVEKHGGEVMIMPLVDGYSNSEQFRKIRSTDDTNHIRPEHLAG